MVSELGVSQLESFLEAIHTSTMATENVTRERSLVSDQEMFGEKSTQSAIVFLPINIAIGVKLDQGNFLLEATNVES